MGGPKSRSHARELLKQWGSGRTTGRCHLALSLGDGTERVVDAAVTCLGTRRAVGWLKGTGLDSPDGIAVDPFMRVVAMTGVYAAEMWFGNQPVTRPHGPAATGR